MKILNIAANLRNSHFRKGEIMNKSTPLNDKIHHPSHYCDGGIETIDYIKAKLTLEEFIGYCKGNVLKYVSRAGKKGSHSDELANELDDLSKAKVYLEFATKAIAEADPQFFASEMPGINFAYVLDKQEG